jgi:hypothetical protein
MCAWALVCCAGSSARCRLTEQHRTTLVTRTTFAMIQPTFFSSFLGSSFLGSSFLGSSFLGSSFLGSSCQAESDSRQQQQVIRHTAATGAAPAQTKAMCAGRKTRAKAAPDSGRRANQRQSHVLPTRKTLSSLFNHTSWSRGAPWHAETVSKAVSKAAFLHD